MNVQLPESTIILLEGTLSGGPSTWMFVLQSADGTNQYTNEFQGMESGCNTINTLFKNGIITMGQDTQMKKMLHGASLPTGVHPFKRSITPLGAAARFLTRKDCSHDWLLNYLKSAITFLMRNNQSPRMQQLLMLASTVPSPEFTVRYAVEVEDGYTISIPIEDAPAMQTAETEPECTYPAIPNDPCIVVLDGSKQYSGQFILLGAQAAHARWIGYERSSTRVAREAIAHHQKTGDLTTAEKAILNQLLDSMPQNPDEEINPGISLLTVVVLIKTGGSFVDFLEIIIERSSIELPSELDEIMTLLQTVFDTASMMWNHEKQYRLQLKVMQREEAPRPVRTRLVTDLAPDAQELLRLSNLWRGAPTGMS